MSNFKVGDRVRAIESSASGGRGSAYIKGNEYVISRLSENRVYTETDEHGSTTNGFHANMFELVVALETYVPAEGDVIEVKKEGTTITGEVYKSVHTWSGKEAHGLKHANYVPFIEALPSNSWELVRVISLAPRVPEVTLPTEQGSYRSHYGSDWYHTGDGVWRHGPSGAVYHTTTHLDELLKHAPFTRLVPADS